MGGADELVSIKAQEKIFTPVGTAMTMVAATK